MEKPKIKTKILILKDIPGFAKGDKFATSQEGNLNDIFIYTNRGECRYEAGFLIDKGYAELSDFPIE